MSTKFPLIKRPKGEVTYEHTLAERFPGDIYMGASERNLYVDQYNEVCLCAYYNIRVPGKYEFIPEYHFYRTKSRMCLELYWNLGHLEDKSEIIEEYHSLKEAKESDYYRDFCDLKANIDKWIRDKKARNEEFSRKYPGGTGATHSEEIHESYDKETSQYVQLYLRNWEKIYAVSKSNEPIHDVLRFFPDFIQLDGNGLNLIEDYHQVTEKIPEGTPYYRAAKMLNEHRQQMKKTRY